MSMGTAALLVLPVLSLYDASLVRQYTVQYSERKV